ncbi:MAG: hypothetical protein AAB383_02810 [Patescibacteria group bacterium]
MRNFKHVPEEVEALKPTGIFNISYTHATSSTSRPGIEKPGKLMAPRIALANEAVPFSGEPQWYTYLFRGYYVSLSSYPDALDDHKWQTYIAHGSLLWTPEGSEGLIRLLEAEKRRILDAPYRKADFDDPRRKTDARIKIDGCIELERAKQEKYATLDDIEKARIADPKPEIYVFDDRVKEILSPGIIFGKSLQQHSHPFVPAEINLERYLSGMFTSLEVGKTREWISGVLERDVPVGSLDALNTWEKSKER